MGKLIVIEGADGSGKATQTKLLAERLQRAGKPVRTLEFPRYREESSALVRLYLGGAFGTRPEDVNAYAASTFFAVDRFASFKQDWGRFYGEGGLVVTDRYTTSNAVHQGEKLSGAERENFARWLFDFEYRLLGLPEPELVLCLDMPPELGQKLLAARRARTGESADIHERDRLYLDRCRENARFMAQRFGWKLVPCAREGELRTVEDIHEEIWGLVSPVIA